jgi:hypothetical protein
MSSKSEKPWFAQLTKQLGEPVTTEQVTWGILLEIDSPIVGHLDLNSRAGTALTRCESPEVFNLLSAGEKRLVLLARSVFSGNEDVGGVASLGGLDRDRRRRIWLLLGYLYLGHDMVWDPENEDIIDWSRLRER